MGKRILGIVVIALLAACVLWYAYGRHALGQAGDGAVKFDDTVAKLTEDPAPPSAAAVTKGKEVPQPAMPVPPAQHGAVADSISPNPANGTVFSGSGKFQVYRQGNLTWRVDTESGRTCILFATMEEWRKPIVYQHGCNNG